MAEPKTSQFPCQNVECATTDDVNKACPSRRHMALVQTVEWSCLVLTSRTEKGSGSVTGLLTIACRYLEESAIIFIWPASLCLVPQWKEKYEIYLDPGCTRWSLIRMNLQSYITDLLVEMCRMDKSIRRTLSIKAGSRSPLYI